MRAFFARWGEGPWRCVDCGELITERGRSTFSLNVHHIDGDETNDEPENLEPLHAICHQLRHPITAAIAAKISETLKGRPSPTKGMTFGEETRQKMSQAQTGERNSFHGRRHDEETKMKMRRPRRRVTCPDCGGEFAVNWATRHKIEGRCG